MNSNKKNIFDDIARGARIQGYLPRTLDAQSYYRRKAAKLKNLTPTSLQRDIPDNVFSRIPNLQSVVGHMVLFEYDAKHKNTLPYWDRFPLIFILKPLTDGFLGLNFHYLPYKWRAILLNRLREIVSNPYYDETTRIKMTYSLLNSTPRFKPYKPCIKRYLATHVSSNFLMIPAHDWEIAVFLPIQDFQGASAQSVWNKSMASIR